MTPQRKPANTRSVNGVVWKSTLKHWWPEFHSFFPSFALPIFLFTSYKNFSFQPAQKVGGSWQKAQLGNDAFAEKHENVFSIHRKMQMLLISDAEN